jgi:membrane-associated protein
MDDLVAWFKTLLNVELLIRWLANYGPGAAYAVMSAIIFAETGLMIGFFLPGDSLLFAAGFAASPDSKLHAILPLNIWFINLCLIPAAILGDSFGYFLGAKAGEALYRRPNSRFFRRDHLLAAKAFYEKYGGMTIVLARFVPIVRTFAPVVAGIAQMRYRRFLAFNVFGGIGWIISLSLLGYFLGGVEFIGQNLELTLLVIIFVSVLPAVIGYLKHRYFEKPAASQAGDAASAPCGKETAGK